MESEKKSLSPREVFVHLLAIVTLYMSAFSFGKLLFDYINRWFPDLLDNRYYGSFNDQATRWSLAMLIIVFPVYYFTTRFLQRLYQREPLQQSRTIRKWLVYLTLFFSAGAIIIDLVTLLYTFLGGELTARFVLKVIAVLFIAASIFGYYFWELRHFRESGEHGEPSARGKLDIRYFVGAIIAAVIAVVVSGFIIVGSPQSGRLARFDEQRVNDLSMVQNEVVNFWQQKNRLPGTLDELRNDLSGFVPPQDPQTQTPYEYHVLSGLKFELCATFMTDSRKQTVSGASVPRPAYPYELGGTWEHDAARTCFTRTIDPERFPGKPVKI